MLTRSKGLPALLSSVVALFLFVACDEFPGLDRSGVTLSPDGKVEVLYVSCPDELVKEIAVYARRDPSTTADDRVFWEISSKKGVNARSRSAPHPRDFESGSA